MDRLGIFVFYDASGIVDRYVEVLLQGLLPYLKKLVIVVNGDITQESEERLEKYTDLIFHRENKGYDCEAYKDVVLSFLAAEDWSAWDEVILFNGTFYAPIFPWKDVFDKMENEPADFWGLTRYPGGGKCSSPGPWLQKEIPEHLQGYFLVCRKKMVCSDDFLYFFQTLSEIRTHVEAVWFYEIKFTSFFKSRGYSSKAYIEVCEQKIDILQGKDPSMEYPFEMVSKLKFPLVKRNAFSLGNFIQAEKTLQFIKEHTEYDVNLIYEHLGRLVKENRFSPFNPILLEKFYFSHKNVYIFGHGKVGKNLAAYFEYKGWKNAGFIVSADSNSARHRTENIYVLGDKKFGPDDGVVIGLMRGFEDVYPVIRREIPDECLFLPKL